MSISANYPTVAPSLDLDFANSKQLDPRVTFARASTGTYYDGVTNAIAEQNLFSYSQDFTNVYWNKQNSSISASLVTDPLGGNTANIYQCAAGNSLHQIVNNAASATIYPNIPLTFSIYLQYTNSRYAIVVLASGNPFGNWASITVDLTLGTITQTLSGGTGAVISSLISQVGSTTWYRITVVGQFTQTNSGNTTGKVLFTDTSTPAIGNYGNYSYPAAGTETMNIWGAQITQYSSVTPYLTTTSSPLTNYIPQLLTAPVNQPRFDANPTTGASLGLLMEQSSTNLLTYSQDYSQASWTKTNATITASANISPDGTLDAQTLTDNSTNGLHNITQTQTLTATPYTFSIYAKAGSITYIKMSLATSGTNGVIFNLSTGAYVSNDAGFTYTTPQSVGNGWYRYSITYTGTAASYIAQVLLCSNSTTFSYAGTGQNAYFFGAQLEALAFPTSYIPTVASQVTRAQDFATMTGTNFSSWFNNNQGTVYCSFDVATITSGTGAIWGLSSGSFVYYVYRSSGANLTAVANNLQNLGIITNINTTQQSVSSYSNISGVTVNGLLNGGALQTIGIPSLSSSFNSLTLGIANASFPMTGHIRKFAYYPIATTSAQLQALTGS